MKRFIVLLTIAAMLAIPGVAAATTPPEPVVAGPATVTLVDSYYSTAAQQLVVTVEVTATEKIGVDPSYGAVYVSPAGQQVDVAGGVGPDHILPGATGLVVMMFPAAEPGGTMTWEIYDQNYQTFDVTMTVPA